MSKIVGINHFALAVANLDESCQFYEKILNLKLIEKRKNDAFIEAGKNCVLALLQYPEGANSFKQNYQPTKTGKAFTHFGFKAECVEDVFSMEKHLIENNVSIIKNAYQRWDGASIYFLDPNNYTLEFLYLKK